MCIREAFYLKLMIMSRKNFSGKHLIVRLVTATQQIGSEVAKTTLLEVVDATMSAVEAYDRVRELGNEYMVLHCSALD